MEIEFVKTSPTQNMTILVKTPVGRSSQVETANSLMSYESVYAEQVGFIEKPDNPSAWARLRMAGGEFCANAAMSLAAYLARRNRGEIAVPLEVSGSDGLVECFVRPQEENAYLATLAMPPPEWMGPVTLPVRGEETTLSAVRLPGITHVIVPAGAFGGNWRAAAEDLAGEWASRIDSPAFGIVFFDEKTCRMDPLVCVKDVESAVWERGCGSGSAAVGAYMACSAGRGLSIDVSQPGGLITVEAECLGASGGSVTRLLVTGTVKIAAEGIAYI
jgi:diaminopimelate epimerase